MNPAVRMFAPAAWFGTAYYTYKTSVVITKAAMFAGGALLGAGAILGAYYVWLDAHRPERAAEIRDMLREIIRRGVTPSGVRGQASEGFSD